MRLRTFACQPSVVKACPLLRLLRRGPYKEDTVNATGPLIFTNRFVNVRPLVRLAAKFAGSGPNRLKMVKLSHQLDNGVQSRPQAD